MPLASRTPRRAFAADEDALDIGIEQDFAALIVDQARERGKRAARAALGDRRAGGFEREGDDLAHLARISALRAETGVQHPGREQRADDLGLVAGLEPAARGAERFAEEIRKLAQAAAPGFARHDLEHGARPQRAAEQREQERRVGAHPVDVGGKARAVAVGELVEGRDIRLAVHGEDRMPAVGQQHRGRGRRMREGKAALLQLRSELRVGGRGQEQYERRRHHVVDEARRGDLLGADAAADAVVALEEQHLAALAAEERGRNERVDAAPDDDVVGRHVPLPRNAAGANAAGLAHFLGTSASTRSGLPVPLTIFSGAAIRIAPLGGSLSRWQRLAKP